MPTPNYNEIFDSAIKTLYELNADERIRQQCEAREEAIRHERTVQKKLADSAKTITEQAEIITAQAETIAELNNAISMQEQTINKLQTNIKELSAVVYTLQSQIKPNND